MSLDTIRVFAISKLAWIKKQQAQLRRQEREAPRQYVDRESHYLWGQRYLLSVIESDEPPSVELKHGRMRLRVRPQADVAKRQSVVEAWYRQQIKAAMPPLLARWQPLLGVATRRFFVSWSTCWSRPTTDVLSH